MTIHAPAPRSRGPLRARGEDAAQPAMVIWEATRACYDGCGCARAETAPARNPFELTADEAAVLMGDVLSFGDPAPIFTISCGGCHQRDVIDIAERGAAMGVRIAVAPSATMTLTMKSLSRLQEAGVSIISLCLDGADQESHDSFRKSPGAYENAMEGWRAARELGMEVQLNTVVTRNNVLELPALASMVRELGVMSWSGFLLAPTGRGLDLGALTATECEDVLNLFYDLRQTVLIKTTEGHHFRRIALQRRALDEAGIDHISAMKLGPLYRALRDDAERRGLLDGDGEQRPSPTIPSANGFVFINHVGQVAPSGFLDVSAGNVRDSSIVDIYRSSELFTGISRPDFLEGRCGVCEYKTVCGGSRSRAYSATGNIYAEDPLCAYEPGSFVLKDVMTGLSTEADPRTG